VYSGPLLNLAEFPDYEKMCGEESEAAGGNFIRTVAAPTVRVGESDVSICPSLKLSAVTSNGTVLSNDQIMGKLTPAESITQGKNLNTIMREQLASTFSSAGSTIVEKYGQIDNFDLSLDPNRNVFVQLEKCVQPKVCFRYEQLFAQEEKRLFESLYKFRKKSFILFGIDQNNQFNYDVEYRLNF
jgi:hypothetical protein